MTDWIFYFSYTLNPLIVIDAICFILPCIWPGYIFKISCTVSDIFLSPLAVPLILISTSMSNIWPSIKLFSPILMLSLLISIFAFLFS